MLYREYSLLSHCADKNYADTFGIEIDEADADMLVLVQRDNPEILRTLMIRFAEEFIADLKWDLRNRVGNSQLADYYSETNVDVKLGDAVTVTPLHADSISGEVRASLAVDVELLPRFRSRKSLTASLTSYINLCLVNLAEDDSDYAELFFDLSDSLGTNSVMSSAVVESMSFAILDELFASFEAE